MSAGRSDVARSKSIQLPIVVKLLTQVAISTETRDRYLRFLSASQVARIRPQSYFSRQYKPSRARTNKYMSSASESEIHKSRAKQATGGDLYDVTDQIDAIRADLQNLTSTVGTLAKGQMRRAQDKTLETAAQTGQRLKGRF